MNNLVSVIVPMYNAMKYIEECLNSILNQTYSNIEVIVIDDGSTDCSIYIVEEMIKNDSRLRLVVNANKKGAAGARNTGIALATGEFISFLDSDDFWRNDKIEKQLNSMITTNSNISYTDYHIINSDSQIMGHFTSPKVCNFSKLLISCGIGCSTVMISKSFLNTRLFPYCPKEDYAFWLMLFKDENVRPVNVTSPLTFYRVTSESISANKFKELGRQWFVLRKFAKLDIFRAVFCSFCYILFGLIKHVFKYRTGL